MENHELGTHNDNLCADSSTGNTPQFICPISPNWPIIWDIFEKSSHHMSIVHATKYVMQQRCHGKRVVEVPNDLK